MRFDLRDLQADPTWAFADLTPKQTRYITHGYYTYPAKFIPQLAARLVRELTQPGDIVVDPFMGSGTTIVESIMQARRAVGVDINPVDRLVSKVKSTPLDPGALAAEFAAVHSDLATFAARRMSRAANVRSAGPDNARIDYWFPPEQKKKLGAIFGRISSVDDSDRKDFFLVAFAQILKGCSIWLQRSVKPTRDPAKRPGDPFDAFARQCRVMQRRNQEFWDSLPPTVREQPAKFRTLNCGDARNLPLELGVASLVVTSPPYVTSYEYADLHQLAMLWLRYAESLAEFRSDFIGSAHSTRAPADLQSETADAIVTTLAGGKKRREVSNYFADMLECFAEMKRVLRVGGKACIVIGDTKLEGVEISNAQVFVEQMGNLGFQAHKIIKREIPSKILPQTRDRASGRFTSSENSTNVLAYPAEFILIMEKQ